MTKKKRGFADPLIRDLLAGMLETNNLVTAPDMSVVVHMRG
jgi:hypothetical protein